LYLDPNPHCYVICADNKARDLNQQDSTAAILQAKYHAHLNNLYDQIISSFEREIDVLQSVCVYSVSNNKKTQNEKTTFGNFCEELSATLLVELGLPAEKVSTGREMSDLEVSFVAIEIHNSLARFANGICDKTSTECIRYELIVRNSLHLLQQSIEIRRRFATDPEIIESTADIPSNSYSSRRSKRWIFTGFLSAVTGLAGEEEIEKLKTVEENLRHVELDNAGEIVKLESKSNEIVSRISKQNERIVQLYKDESVLNEFY